MNCESIQSLLEQGAVIEFDSVQDHLGTCPSCAQKAARGRHTEVVLRQYLDDFIDATPPQWDQAVYASAGATSRFSIQTLAVGMAIAASLVLAVVVQVPTGHAGAGFSDDRAVALTRDFEAIHTTLIDVDELSRSEQDARHRAVMADKSHAFETAEEAWQLLAEEEDPERALGGLMGLGELYQSMGQTFREFDQPTYLTDSQSVVYSRALDRKAVGFEERAVSAWEEARKVAINEDFESDLKVLDDWLDDLEQRLDDAAAAKQAELEAAAAVRERRGVELALPTSGDALVPEDRGGLEMLGYIDEE